MIKQPMIGNQDLDRINNGAPIRSLCIKCLKSTPKNQRLQFLADVGIDGVSAKHVYVLKHVTDTCDLYDRYEDSIKAVFMLRILPRAINQEEGNTLLAMWGDPVFTAKMGGEAQRKHMIVKMVISAEFVAIGKELGMSFNFMEDKP